MRSFLFVTAAAAALLPSIALACGGEGITYYEHYGTPAFAPNGEITAVAPTQHDVYDWVGIANATDPRTARGLIEVMPEMESTGPRIRLGASHVFVRINGSLFRLDEAATVRSAIVDGIASFDATLDENPVIVTGGWSMEGVPSISIRASAFGRRAALEEVATAPADTCDASKLAIARTAAGAVVGLCGDSPFLFDGETITVLPPLGLGYLDTIATAGFDAEGALTFFTTTPSQHSYSESKLHAIRRSAVGEWSAETIATLPLASIADGRLVAATADAGVVAGFDEYDGVAMHTFRRVDGAWVTEKIADIATNDRLAVRGDAASMQVLAGGFTLRSYEQDPQSGAWTSTELGAIGFAGRNEWGGGGCSLSGMTATAPNAALMMLALAAMGLVIARRK